jgi:hypothetical protein
VPMEQVSNPPVASAGALGVDANQLMHPHGQVRLRRPDDHVLMVRHPAVGMAAPVEPLTNVAHQVQPNQATRSVSSRYIAVRRSQPEVT